MTKEKPPEICANSTFLPFSGIIGTVIREVTMAVQYTMEELEKLSNKELSRLVLSQQEQLARLNENIENLIEQIRIANVYRFGKKTEKLDAIDGQYSFFNEAEVCSDESAEEPPIEEVVAAYKRKKQKGKRDSDLEGFPTEPHDHLISEEELDQYFGKGNWKKMPFEKYRRLRFEPASYIVEEHTVGVYVGTGGDHQDEFLRGKRPKDLIRNSIATPSLGGAILNGKYTNSLPLNRLSQEFERNGITLSRQTMANWVITFAEKYFTPLWLRMKEHLLALPVTQCDETPVQVLEEKTSGGKSKAKCYMWVHRSGEYYSDRQLVLYEYQRGRDHKLPMAFYKDYSGVLLTDSLQQYHILDEELPDLENANCWSHARRPFAEVCKALGDNPGMRTSTAHKALELIGAIFDEDKKLRGLSAEDRLRERQIKVKPLVEAYFAWVRETLENETNPPKGKTAEGLRYSLNQEKYLKVFLENGDVPMDNSASERAIRTFCIGRNNWVIIDSVKGAKASAVCYSLSETAKLNNLNVYSYFTYLLTEIPRLMDDDGNVDPTKLDNLLPWSDIIQKNCPKRRL